MLFGEIGIKTLVPTVHGPNRRNVDVEDDGDRFDKSGIVYLDGRTFSYVVIRSDS